MIQVQDLITERETYSVSPETTVKQAVRFMVERNIGALAVLKEGKLAGIFTERDLLKRVVNTGRDVVTTQVGEVMTTEPHTVTPDTDIEDCLRLMHANNFRHLPICKDDKIFGLVSLRDILLREFTEKEDEVRTMRAYISNA